MKKIFTIFILFLLFGLNKTFAQTVTDIDGNVYDTISIGTQVWMKQNLKTTKYRDGSGIPNVTDNNAWSALTTGARCYYNNDSTTIAPVYGALYNWYAANDARSLCPTGWHVPSDAEWSTLTTYLGGDGVAGGKLKEIDTLHWNSPNTGADNSSGFSALPGGNRGGNGNYSGIDNLGDWWSVSESSGFSAWGRHLVYDNTSVSRYNYTKKGGLSVRCFKDLSVDINDINNNNQIKIYPYPATNNLTIETNSNTIIEIFNVQGQIVKTLNTSNTKTIIDISKLSSGVYAMKIKKDNGIIVRKLIKQ